MAATYSDGAKVRVRASEHVHSVWHSHLDKFAGMTGVVVSSVRAVGFVTYAWAEHSSPAVQTIRLYRVHLDAGIELNFVTAERLETTEPV